jgi:hypothetical protein
MCQQIIPAQTSEENQSDYGKNIPVRFIHNFIFIHLETNGY